MDPITGGLGNPGAARKPMRNLQPRAAAALDFNEDSDDDDGGFINGGNTSSLNGNYNNNSTGNGQSRSSVLGAPSTNGSNIGATFSASGGDGRNGKGGTDAGTLSSGKKYIMIAVDYKDKDGAGGGSTESGSALASGASSINNGSRRGPGSVTTGSSSKRQSRTMDDEPTSAGARRLSTLSNHITTTTTTTVHESVNVNGLTEKRRSILLPSGAVAATHGLTTGADSGLFGLDSMLGNFAIDTDFMSSSSKIVGGGGSADGVTVARQNSLSSRSGPNSASTDSGAGGEDMSRSGSRRGNKVTFNISGDQQEANGQSPSLDEAAVTEALAQRMAAHKSQQQANGSTVSVSSKATGTSMTLNGSLAENGPQSLDDFPEITLPKPVSRKKVRHVQIQTQHCIMRPMFTQTESTDTLVQDLDVKVWGNQTQTQTQTTDDASETGTIVASEAGTSPSSGTATIANGVKSTSTSTAGPRANSKVASLVASLSQPTTATTATTATVATPATMTSRGQGAGAGTQTTSAAVTTTTTTTTTMMTMTSSSSSSNGEDPSNATSSEVQQELQLLRQQNAQLQNRVTTLERDLASEMRARTRTAVAMQDTRDKFEALSEMAYKKLKEMIFQRHVLEMEIRELRTQVDLQTEGSDLYLQQRHVASGASSAVIIGQ
ncbi:hypothetical protein BGZ94_003400 [Podila epigama]|nr:hypothetical protein BGZ94_003400 [Podila epigama]